MKFLMNLSQSLLDTVGALGSASLSLVSLFSCDAPEFWRDSRLGGGGFRGGGADGGNLDNLRPSTRECP